MLLAAVAAVARCHAAGAPDCGTPGGPHRAAAEGGDGGFSAEVVRRWLNVAATGSEPLSGFLLTLPPGVVPCAVPASMLLVDCGDGSVALTHSAKWQSQPIGVQLRCGRPPCSPGAVTLHALTALNGPWYTVRAAAPALPQSCGVGTWGAVPTDAAGWAAELRSAEERLVPAPPWRVGSAQIPDPNEAAQCLADPSERRRSAVASGAAQMLRGYLSSLPRSLLDGDSAAAAAEALSVALDSGAAAVPAAAVGQLCTLFTDGEHPPTRMWAAAALATALDSGVADPGCPGLAEAIVRSLRSAIVDCPYPSCRLPGDRTGLAAAAAMSFDHWPQSARRDQTGGWVVTWAALRVAAVLARREAGRSALVNAGAVAPLCFLVGSPDGLEQPAAEVALESLTGNDEHACDAAEATVRSAAVRDEL
eukprot:TRINITY_DN12136_c0_g1_i5.p1 TRINITY_DN12136_c0_g1~~TRINITY_DN12136_c0_g1_i5.p1  ORF type:complete len:434 (+),score=111.77 TRINITY_DN12136_c0_g1_i5:44-1303(+)